MSVRLTLPVHHDRHGSRICTREACIRVTPCHLSTRLYRSRRYMDGAQQSGRGKNRRALESRSKWLTLRYHHIHVPQEADDVYQSVKPTLCVCCKSSK